MSLTTRRDLPTLASEINREHEAAERAINESLHHARRCGELLIEAKAACAHGEWGEWLAANFRASETTARGYMRIARRWEELPDRENGNALPIREALAALAAPAARELDAVHDDLGLADAPDPRVHINREILNQIRQLAPGVQFTATGMVLPDDLSFENWSKVGKLLSALPANPEAAPTSTGGPSPELVRPLSEEEQDRLAKAEATIANSLDTLRELDWRPQPETPAELIPADGMELFARAPDWHELHSRALIFPSSQAGFYYVVAFDRSDPDENLIVEGSKKPIRADAIASFLDHLGFPWRNADWVSSATEPVNYNTWLYTSHEDYVQQAVLGQAVA